VKDTIIAVRVEAAHRDALRRLTDEDQLSMAGAMRHYLADLLRQRGLMPCREPSKERAA
jgi:hypothetical protein